MLYTTMKNKWARTLAAVAGSILYAVGVNLFLVPLDLYTGGIMGVCQLVRTLVYQAMGVTGGYDFSGLLYYAVNVPIFLLAFRMAVSSAWDRVFLSMVRRLYPRPMTLS